MRTGIENYSIGELLDDHIAKLLMKSDGVSRCALQVELAQMARSHAGMRSEESCDD
jgi:hypothetical protein